MEDKVKPIIEVSIRNWVLENFGETELKDPSWNIESLAKHIAESCYLIHQTMDIEWAKEDVRYVAEDLLEIKLTDEEIDKLGDYWYNSEAFQASDYEYLKSIIRDQVPEKFVKGDESK